MKNVTCLAVLLSVASASASTLLHFTFDEGTVGKTVTNGSVIVNAANPGVHDATVYGIHNTTLLPTSEFMPYLTNGIPSTHRYYDPLTNVRRSSVDRAIRFTATTLNGHSAVLEVENSNNLHPESFTVEAVVRFPPGVGNLGGWNVIAVHPSYMPCKNADAWGFRILDNGKLCVRFTPPQEITSDLAENNVTIVLENFFTDGLWHHVAFTCEPNASDSTKTDVKLYRDYTLKTSKTLDFRPQFSSEANCPIWIGANRQNAGNFTGEIGEIRMSDAALEPQQFIRPRSVTDDLDVVLRYDFENIGNGWMLPTNEVMNVADPSLMNGKITKVNLGDAGVYPRLTNDSPAELLCPYKGSLVKYENNRSLFSTYADSSSRANTACVSVVPLDDWFSKTNFTVECFYRSNGTIEKFTPFVFRFGGVNVQFNVGVGGTVGKLYTALGPAGITQAAEQKQFTDPVRSDDGRWHHAALVVRQGENAKLYRDWNPDPVAECVLTTNLYPKSVASDAPLYIAGGSIRNTFNGQLDEVRITLRALEPDEFIRPFKDAGTLIILK